jgi:hypothetical protein
MEKYPARDSVILWDAASLAAAQRKTASVHAARECKIIPRTQAKKNAFYIWIERADSSRTLLSLRYWRPVTPGYSA